MSNGTCDVCALTIGIKISIFLAIFALSTLVVLVSKRKKHMYGLALMGFVFLCSSIVEFLFAVSQSSEGVLQPLDIYSNYNLILNPLRLVAVLGILWYLIGIKKNIQDYI